MAIGRGVGVTKKIPLVIVLGPTASGKSFWVNAFAKKYNGEVVSADSRQVYKQFSIGTNKEKGVWEKRDISFVYTVDEVLYHLIDFVAPEANFSVFEYQKKAHQAINEVHSRGNIPFLSGGTGMYIDAVVDNWELSKDSFDSALRKELESKTNIELIKRLEKSDPEGAVTIDVHNTARLIRAIEIAELTGTPKGERPKKGEALYEVLKIGVQKERDALYDRINERVDEMFEEGLVEEVEELSKNYSKDLPVFLSIGYKEVMLYLEKEISLDKARELIKQNTRRYAKRQMTWWRRDKNILWCATREEADEKISAFLKSIE